MNSQQAKDARKKAAHIRRQEMKGMMHPNCQVCGFSYPPIVHLHHIHQLSESKNDSAETVFLCPNCHAMVHEIRRVYFSGRRVHNLEMRLGHLDYWLDACSRDVSSKLRSIAEQEKNIYKNGYKTRNSGNLAKVPNPTHPE